MKILAIETSCDETAASVVENGTRVLSNVVASSQELHAKTGGIIPEEAARQQIQSILPVIEEAIKDIPVDHIDALAVTVGPGLIGSLLVGVETVKTLGLLWNKPIIPVNHLIGHIYANWLENDPPPVFPLVTLIVSGGHTDLVYMTSHTTMEWIGGTRDDAAGEAFDKTARLLGLPYPGGPSISKAAAEYLIEGKEKLSLFPRPMIHEDNYDLSFSGLKTAVQREILTNQKKDVNQYAAEIQEAIIDSLTIKTMKAVKNYSPQSLLLAGGVSANTRLRERFKIEVKESEVKLFIPEPKYCTDNAAPIAAAAFFHNTPLSWKEVVANPQLTVTDGI